MTPRNGHQLAHLIGTDKRWCATTPVQLPHRPGGIKQSALQCYFPIQMFQVRYGPPPVLGDNFATRAVKTDCVTKWNMKIQRQRSTTAIAGLCQATIICISIACMKLYCSRVGCVAGSRFIVPVDEITVKNDCCIHS